MSYIFYLMGKSATGKDTVFEQLEQAMPQLKRIISYTTRPIRKGEQNGREYFFTDEKNLEQLEGQGKVIELRRYHTAKGIWKYATVADAQVDLTREDYLVIGTLESYRQIRKYYGKQAVIPLYLEVEDGLRLERAVQRERKQKNPCYDEVCRRYLADEEDFSEDRLKEAGIGKRFQNRNQEQCIRAILLYIRGILEKG